MGDYTTTVELRKHIDKDGTADDAVLDTLIDAAEEAINNYCNRPDGFLADSVASTREYVADGNPTLRVDDNTGITLVETKDISETASDYVALAATDWIAYAGSDQFPNFQPDARDRPFTKIMIDPAGDEAVFPNGYLTGSPGFRPIEPVRRARGVPTVRVTATWGYATPAPKVVVTATIIQASQWFKRGQGAWGDTLASVDLGQMMFTKGLEPTAKFLLTNGGLRRTAYG